MSSSVKFVVVSKDRAGKVLNVGLYRETGLEFWICCDTSQKEEYGKYYDNLLVIGDFPSKIAKINGVLKYFGKGAKVVFADDDVIHLEYWADGHKLTAEDIKIYVHNMFEAIEDIGTIVWFTQQPTRILTRKFIFCRAPIAFWGLGRGVFWGIKWDGHLFDEKYVIREDLMITLEVIRRYGKVLIDNRILAHCKQYEEDKSEHKYRRELSQQVLEYFLRDYGHLIYLAKGSQLRDTVGEVHINIRGAETVWEEWLMRRQS